ncbi:hypothetical protein KUCAC02_003398, partial [Chaenocephalus aceratus]
GQSMCSEHHSLPLALGACCSLTCTLHEDNLPSGGPFCAHTMAGEGPILHLKDSPQPPYIPGRHSQPYLKGHTPPQPSTPDLSASLKKRPLTAPLM